MRALEFGRRVPGRSALAILWFDLGRFLTHVTCRLLYRLRVSGYEHVPSHGPVLAISNHQSLLDPIVNGAALRDRQFTPIARESLFRFRPFGLLIRSYGAVPLAKSGSDIAALRVAVAELAAGRCVLMYPEGTRSADGTMRPFEKGVMLLQRRAKVDVLPMGMEGASDAWPRGSRFPRLSGRIEVRVGEVIPASRLAALSPDEAKALLETTVDRLRLEARASLRERTRGRWPRLGSDLPLARAST